MRTIFLILFLIISFNTFSQEQIPNGNFENWTNGEADNWNSVPIFYTGEQTNAAVQGNSAVKIVSQSVFGQFIPGLITLGNIDILNQTLGGGIEYSDKPDGIRFFFKYIPSSIDTMFFGAFMTKWNNINQQTDTICMTGYLNSNVYDIYTKIELPFIYQSNEIPDTLNIIFSSSGFNGNEGSSLFIDSLSVFYGNAVSPTFCFPADEITSSSFKAHWMTIPNALSYSIDVSDNKYFTTFLNGYENLNTGADTFAAISVTPGTYYYRTRVNYDTETSINSNTIEVTIENTETNHLNLKNIIFITNQNYITLKTSNFYFDSVKLYNIEGKLIKEINKTGQEAHFFVTSPGIYISEITKGNQRIRKKIGIIF